MPDLKKAPLGQIKHRPRLVCSNKGSSVHVKKHRGPRPPFRSKYGNPFGPRIVRVSQGGPNCPRPRPFCPPLPPLPCSYPTPYGCPPLPPCCPPPVPPSCGTKSIIRVPKGCPPPLLPSPWTSRGEQQPCYNNCNFYTMPDPYRCPPPPPSYGYPFPPPLPRPPPPPFGSPGMMMAGRGPSCTAPCMRSPPMPPFLQGALGDNAFNKLLRQACASSGVPSLGDSDFQAELDALAASSSGSGSYNNNNNEEAPRLSQVTRDSIG